MNFKIEKSILTAVVRNVIAVVPNKSTLPILSNIKIETNGETLTLSGTDLISGISESVSCEILESGSCSVNAKIFNDIVRSMGDGTITVKKVGSKVSVKCNNSEFELSSLDSDTFPSQPVIDQSKSIVVKPEVLFEVFNSSSYAISDDEIRRPNLCGVFWKINEEKMVMVSTDGQRLAKYLHYFNEGELNSISGTFSGIIPTNILNIAGSVLNNVDYVSIQLNKSNISISNGVTLVYSRLIDGEYVDYNRVIPNENDEIGKLQISRKELLESIKRVSIMCNNINNVIKIDILEDSVKISTNTNDLGKSNEIVICDSNFKDSFKYNYELITDALKSMNCNKIEMSFYSIGQVIIRPAIDKSNNEVINLVLPIKEG